jgi:hypothetical protein
VPSGVPTLLEGLAAVMLILGCAWLWLWALVPAWPKSWLALLPGTLLPMLLAVSVLLWPADNPITALLILFSPLQPVLYLLALPRVESRWSELTVAAISLASMLLPALLLRMTTVAAQATSAS